MFFDLLRARRFAPLFWCQFLSAFNDNFVRNMLAMFVLFRLGGKDAGPLITLAIGIFIMPSLLLSALAGDVADSHDKAAVARALKFSEILVQILAAAGVWFASLPLLYLALFGLGVISTLFGPVKYGLLPDHLRPNELVAGNALIEAATFLAILFGLVAGALAASRNVPPQAIVMALMAIALAAFATSWLIPPTRIGAPGLRARSNVVACTFALLGELRDSLFLWRSAHALSWFWLTGAVAVSLVPVAVRTATGGDIAVEAAISGFFAIGIGAGSLAAARIAGRNIALAPVPRAAVGMGVFLLALGLATNGIAVSGASDVSLIAFLLRPRGLFIGLGVTCLAAAGGIFTVPLFAAVQAAAAPERRARTIAGINILNAVYIIAGTLSTALLQSRIFGFSEPMLLALLGVLNFGAAAFVQMAILPLSRKAND